jgi:lysophospholipase L1-like esterase
MKRHFLTLAIAATMACTMFAQAPQFTETTYYRQRASLFEQLPVDKEDVIILGNSITDGGEWGELFGDLHFKNRGISGDVIEGVKRRLSAVTVGQPKKIFLMIGTNDLSRGASVDYVVSGIKEIVETIHKDSPRTKVYVQSIFPVNPAFSNFKSHSGHTQDILDINKALSESEQECNYTFVNVHKALADEENHMSSQYTNDGLHLLGSGYVVWRSVLLPYVNE